MQSKKFKQTKDDKAKTNSRLSLTGYRSTPRDQLFFFFSESF